MNLIDITDLAITEDVLTAAAAVRAGDPLVDVEHLSPSELHALTELLGVSREAQRAWGPGAGNRGRVIGPIEADPPWIERALEREQADLL